MVDNVTTALQVHVEVVGLVSMTISTVSSCRCVGDTVEMTALESTKLEASSNTAAVKSLLTVMALLQQKP